MIGLTHQQAKLLSFLKSYIARNGYPPTHDEMRLAMGLASKSGIHRILGALRERGLIIHRRGHARSVWILAEIDRIADWRPSPGVVAFAKNGDLMHCERLRFISADNLRPLNLKQLEKRP